MFYDSWTEAVRVGEELVIRWNDGKEIRIKFSADVNIDVTTSGDTRHFFWGGRK